MLPVFGRHEPARDKKKNISPRGNHSEQQRASSRGRHRRGGRRRRKRSPERVPTRSHQSRCQAPANLPMRRTAAPRRPRIAAARMDERTGAASEHDLHGDSADEGAADHGEPTGACAPISSRECVSISGIATIATAAMAMDWAKSPAGSRRRDQRPATARQSRSATLQHDPQPSPTGAAVGRSVAARKGRDGDHCRKPGDHQRDAARRDRRGFAAFAARASCVDSSSDRTSSSRTSRDA